MNAADDASASRELRGIVLDEAERPVAKALVYLLPKGVRGLRDPQSVPHAGTDGSGRWHIQPAIAPGGQWLCAIADGFLPDFKDGDILLQEEDIQLHLRSGPRLVVDLRGSEETAHLITTVRIEGKPERDSYPLPGPYAKPLVLMVEDMSGLPRRVIPVGTTGPIIVRARRFSSIALPEAVELPHPAGQATFELRPSCILQVRVIDAAADRPLSSEIRTELLDKDGQMFAASIVTNPNGMLEFSNAVPPGVYGLRISSAGYATETLYTIVLMEPGVRQAVTVRLKIATDSGTTLRWDVLSAPENLKTPTVYIHKAGTQEAWVPVPVTAPEKGSCKISGMVTGAYDLIAVHAGSAHAAVVRSQWLDPEKDQSPTWLEWKRGLFVEIGALPLVRDGRRIERIRCSCEEVGTLPRFMAVPGLEQFWTPEQVPTQEAKLGPYPCDSISVNYKVEGVSEEKKEVVQNAVADRSK